jgi:hypothetical protein
MCFVRTISVPEYFLPTPRIMVFALASRRKRDSIEDRIRLATELQVDPIHLHLIPYPHSLLLDIVVFSFENGDGPDFSAYVVEPVCYLCIVLSNRGLEGPGSGFESIYCGLPRENLGL